MKVYLIDAQGIYTGEVDVDPMAALPPCVMTAPPETSGNEVAQWQGTEWAVLPEVPAQDTTVVWADVRRERNARLSACDWTQLPDSPLTNEARTDWAEYRQALRDVTEQADPFAIVWPVQPE